MYVTSGTRTAASQARAMFEKIRAGASMNDYPQQALRGIMAAYRAGMAAHETDAQIENRMAAVIQAQMNSGIFISPHLTGRGVDVRTRDLTPEQERTLERIAGEEGVRTHPEGRPPHLHLTFPRQP